MSNKVFSLFKVKTILYKELFKLWRDKISLVSLLIIPVLQVILYGFVLNSNPKHMPLVVVDQNKTVFSRTIIAGLENSQYFTVTNEVSDIGKGERLLDQGKVQFMLFIPSSFSQELIQGKQPKILLKADAINNMACAGGISVAEHLQNYVLNDVLKGVMAPAPDKKPFSILIEQKYNPTGQPQYYTIPGVLCLSLSMITLTMTLMSVVYEKEHNTMESLLTTPVKPLEIMLGKIAPFVVIVYAQLFFILIVSQIIFGVPFLGSYLLLAVAAFPFIISSLFVGLLFSIITTNQYQAAQIGNFYVLPNFLFSGFIFPFHGMPMWAQIIGEIFPLTHFLRVLNSIMIKGGGFYDILPLFWPLVLITVILVTVTVMRYKQTLD